ncbi:MAG: anti-sigma factor family protein [Candidatus Methylomirabilales bacterium]
MRCKEARLLLSAYVAQELTVREREELEEHLQGCLVCQEELEAYRRTWAALGIWEDVPPRPGLREELLARIGGEVVPSAPPRRERWSVRPLLWPALLAALLSVAASLFLPYERIIELCRLSLRSSGLELPEGGVYFLAGTLYGLLPLLLVGLLMGRGTPGRPPFQGLAAGCLFALAILPYALVQCSTFGVGLALSLIGGMAAGAIGGSLGGFWLASKGLALSGR